MEHYNWESRPHTVEELLAEGADPFAMLPSYMPEDMTRLQAELQGRAQAVGFFPGQGEQDAVELSIPEALKYKFGPARFLVEPHEAGPVIHAVQAPATNYEWDAATPDERKDLLLCGECMPDGILVQGDEVIDPFESGMEPLARIVLEDTKLADIATIPLIGDGVMFRGGVMYVLVAGPQRLEKAGQVEASSPTIMTVEVDGLGIL